MPLIEREPDALARVYAKSLYELAEQAGGRDNAQEILGELDAILEAARQDRRFGEFLASRVLGTKERDDALVKILQDRASDLTLRFLRLLNRKNRLGHLPAVTRAFESLVQQAFGRVEADVFTAHPLDADAKERVRGQVAQALGHDVILHCYTDESLLGGIKLRVGDRLIDDSLAARLRRVTGKLTTQGTANVRSRSSQIIDP